MVKTRLAQMTWKEAEEAYKANPVILIPSASIEQHGPATPVGDFRISEWVGDRIAERTGAIVAPMLPYGYSEVFRRFPGTVTLQGDTVRAVMYDVVVSFAEQGLDHLVFLCGHNGNMPILDQVARRVRREYGIRMGCIEPFRLFSGATMAEAYGKPGVAIGHGSDPIMSFNMFLFPDDCRQDLTEAENLNQYDGMTIRGSTNVALGDVAGHIYFDTLDIAPNGVMGDVSNFDAEAGGKLLAHVVDKGVEFVNIFKQHDTRIR
ncbi:MAG TPA: creatininase family protein [Thermomicrobiales bacterium]|nr:creatininase family protein [Thermomicrobiales bacterium]